MEQNIAGVLYCTP